MGQIKKVVIDTNVIISAYGWRGVPEELLSLIRQRTIKNYTSPVLLKELQRVITYSKLGFMETLKSKMKEFILYHCIMVKPEQVINVIKDDPTDNRVLECALEAKADYIISGDSHLLSLKEYEGITIVTPGDFLKIFRNLQ